MRTAYNVERLLSKLGQTTTPEFDQRTLADVFAAMEVSTRIRPARRWQDWWRTITESRITRYATAAAFVLAVLWLAGHLIGNPALQGPTATAPKKTDTPITPDVNKDRLQAEATLAAELKAKNDIPGLIDLLDKGLPQTRVLVAGHLAQIGDERTLPALSRLAHQWTGPVDRNPFAAAMEAILSGRGQQDASGKGASGVRTGEEPASSGAGSPTELPVIRYVHTTSRTPMSDGEVEAYEVWYAEPNRTRVDGPEGMEIRDGDRCLRLDKHARTAQFCDPEICDCPGQRMLELSMTFARMFREGGPRELTYAKNTAECTASVDVYDINLPGLQGVAKAWVDPSVLLPTRVSLPYCPVARWVQVDPIEADRDSQALGGTGSASSRTIHWGYAGGAMEMEFDYSPIPDSLFGMQVPSGYRLQPVQQRAEIRGTVMTPDGRPVPGAMVSIASRWSYTSEYPKSVTADDQGRFQIVPPAPWRRRVDLPIVLSAVDPQDPNSIAWRVFFQGSFCDRRVFPGVRHSRLWRPYVEDFDPAREPDANDVLPFPPSCFVAGEQSGSYTTFMYDLSGQEKRAESPLFECLAVLDVVLVMQPASRILGTVTDREGRPIADAEVTAVLKTFMPLTGVWFDPMAITTRSDQTGAFEIRPVPGLPDGSTQGGPQFEIRAKAGGYIDRRLEVQCQQGEMAADITLDRAGVTIRGALMDNYGSLLADRIVGVYTDGDSISSTTDAHGRFTLEGCPETETIRVVAHPSNADGSDADPNRADDVRYPSVEALVEYVAGQTDYEVTLVTILPELTVEVEVVDSGGNPVAMAPVSILGKGITPDLNLTKRADDQGRCRFTDVPEVEDLRVSALTGEVFTDGDLAPLERPRLMQITSQLRMKYRPMEVPAPTMPGQKYYLIRVEVLTHEESMERLWKHR